MTKKISNIVITTFIAFSLLAGNVVEANSVGQQSKTLKKVVRKGGLRCGIRNGAASGFKEAGKIWCRGLAAAIGVDVTLIELSIAETYLAFNNSGPREKRVDVSFRSITERLGRDLSHKIVFVDQFIFDPTLIRSDDPNFPFSGSIAAQVAYKNSQPNDYICARDGQVQEDLLLAAGVNQAKIFETTVDLVDYVAGNCDAVNQLLSILNGGNDTRGGTDADIAFTIAAISANTRDRDPRWTDLVKYYMGGMKLAVLEGVDSTNANNPGTSVTAQQLLGEAANNDGNTAGDLVGLDADWMRRAILEVGNYNEIFEAGFGFPPTGINEVSDGNNSGLMRALDHNPAP